MAKQSYGWSGIGGWLLFFLLALGLFSPLTTLATVISTVADPAVAAAYGDHWASVRLAEWLLVAFFIGGAWFLVWRLIYVRTWQTVRLVIAGIWILQVGGLFAELVFISWIAGIEFGALVGEMGAEAVRPFVFCTVWTLYFLKSERVANTYPRHGAEDELAEVFG